MFKYALTLLFCVVCIVFSSSARASSMADINADQALRSFYTDRNHTPLWTPKSRFTQNARALPSIIEKLAPLHALDPAIYDVSGMQAMLATPPADDTAWQQAEILWSYNAWLFASDLAGHSLDSGTLSNLFKGNLERNLNALAPESALYQALSQKYVSLANAQAPEKLDFSARVFRPAMQHSAVLPLRARMLELGYLTSPPIGDDETLYDPTLVDAVKAFQRDHALAADGQIGAATLEALNAGPARQRIAIVANMQRLRSPTYRAREPRRIDVSIARYHLDAYEDGKPVLSMPVIVGTARRQTISFRTEISGVRLNPTWNVPKTIKNEDYIPLLYSDPARLSQRYGVQVIKDGEIIDPTTVDWNSKTRSDLASLRMWHPAGAGNPLGRYRVLMDNRHDIYLHDTNAPGLFKRDARALSSGCIRVEQPEALTDYIFKEKQGWSPDRTREVLARGRTADVIIENKIPIYLDYMTVWFNDRGQLVFGTDIYALDKPRYDGQVNKVLITATKREKLLAQATALLQPAPTDDHVL